MDHPRSAFGAPPLGGNTSGPAEPDPRCPLDGAAIPKEEITGLILAGGRGSRMGGVDKGLQTHLGVPLALHALMRLAPQVGH
ncbi:NTP transferase domain-containing protein, partial [Piscinibacter sp.]|uniref:NTP transferase domain-containing protein n=1 Tax=Piscinibacter sp. TaxID=1903157 RepID=UPI002F3E661B